MDNDGAGSVVSTPLWNIKEDIDPSVNQGEEAFPFRLDHVAGTSTTDSQPDLFALLTHKEYYRQQYIFRKRIAFHPSFQIVSDPVYRTVKRMMFFSLNVAVGSPMYVFLVLSTTSTTEVYRFQVLSGLPSSSGKYGLAIPINVSNDCGLYLSSPTLSVCTFTRCDGNMVILQMHRHGLRAIFLDDANRSNMDQNDGGGSPTTKDWWFAAAFAPATAAGATTTRATILHASSIQDKYVAITLAGLPKQILLLRIDCTESSSSSSSSSRGPSSPALQYPALSLAAVLDIDSEVTALHVVLSTEGTRDSCILFVGDRSRSLGVIQHLSPSVLARIEDGIPFAVPSTWQSQHVSSLSPHLTMRWNLAAAFRNEDGTRKGEGAGTGASTRQSEDTGDVRDAIAHAIADMQVSHSVAVAAAAVSAAAGESSPASIPPLPASVASFPATTESWSVSSFSSAACSLVAPSPYIQVPSVVVSPSEEDRNTYRYVLVGLRNGSMLRFVVRTRMIASAPASSSSSSSSFLFLSSSSSSSSPFSPSGEGGQAPAQSLSLSMSERLYGPAIFKLGNLPVQLASPGRCLLASSSVPSSPDASILVLCGDSAYLWETTQTTIPIPLFRSIVLPAHAKTFALAVVQELTGGAIVTCNAVVDAHGCLHAGAKCLTYPRSSCSVVYTATPAAAVAISERTGNGSSSNNSNGAGLVLKDLHAHGPSGLLIARAECAVPPCAGTHTMGSIVVIKRNGEEGIAYPIPHSRHQLMFGNHEGCDIRMNLPSVSNEHARIVFDNSSGAAAVLWNLSETGITCVNNIPLKFNGSATLRHGATIAIADRLFKYYVGGSCLIVIDPAIHDPDTDVDTDTDADRVKDAVVAVWHLPPSLWATSVASAARPEAGSRFYSVFVAASEGPNVSTARRGAFFVLFLDVLHKTLMFRHRLDFQGGGVRAICCAVTDRLLPPLWREGMDGILSVDRSRTKGVNTDANATIKTCAPAHKDADLSTNGCDEGGKSITDSGCTADAELCRSYDDVDTTKEKEEEKKGEKHNRDTKRSMCAKCTFMCPKCTPISHKRKRLSPHPSPCDADGNADDNGDANDDAADDWQHLICLAKGNVVAAYVLNPLAREPYACHTLEQVSWSFQSFPLLTSVFSLRSAATSLYLHIDCNTLSVGSEKDGVKVFTMHPTDAAVYHVEHHRHFARAVSDKLCAVLRLESQRLQKQGEQGVQVLDGFSIGTDVYDDDGDSLKRPRTHACMHGRLMLPDRDPSVVGPLRTPGAVMAHRRVFHALALPPCCHGLTFTLCGDYAASQCIDQPIVLTPSLPLSSSPSSSCSPNESCCIVAWNPVRRVVVGITANDLHSLDTREHFSFPLCPPSSASPYSCSYRVNRFVPYRCNKVRMHTQPRFMRGGGSNTSSVVVVDDALGVLSALQWMEPAELATLCVLRDEIRLRTMTRCDEDKPDDEGRLTSLLALSRVLPHRSRAHEVLCARDLFMLREHLLAVPFSRFSALLESPSSPSPSWTDSPSAVLGKLFHVTDILDKLTIY